MHPMNTLQAPHQAFAAHAHRQPNAPAVRHGDTTLSYGQLHTWVEQLAEALRQRGAGPGQRVALCVDKNPAAIALMLAVMRCGAAYVILDPDHPPERLGFIIDDSQACVVVVEAGLAGQLPAASANTPPRWVWDGAPCPAAPPTAAHATAPAASATPFNASTLDAPAYCLYTSGSTGRPKGVLVSHRSVAHLIADWQQRCPVRPHECFSLWTVLGFDVSVWEWLLPLATGAALAIPDALTRLDTLAFCHWLAAQQVSTAYFPPHMVRQWPALFEQLPRLPSRCLIGVEPLLERPLLPLVQRDGLRLINLYGPTETTIYCTLYDAALQDRDGILPIGYPIGDNRVHLLGEDGQPVPPGCPGELCLAGPGVALGYLNRPELTAERFVPEPGRPGERMYRTGDRVFQRPDGALEFVGRIDNQLKISGHRLEPGEIEQALCRLLPAVEAAVVLGRKVPEGQTELVACVVAVAGQPAPSPAQMMQALLDTLPVWMVPTRWQLLPALPLTVSGKQDRKALAELPLPERCPLGAPALPSPWPAECEALARCIAQLLNLPAVQPDDGFLALGGDSLQARRLLARLGLPPGGAVLRQLLGGGSLLAFAQAHPEALAAAQTWASRPLANPSPPSPTNAQAEPTEPTPAAPVQLALYAHERLEPGSTAYHVSTQWQLHGTLDLSAWQQALDQLAQRHAMLRGHFVELADGQIGWHTVPRTEFVLPLERLSAADAAAWEASFHQRFALLHGPLWRAVLWQHSPTQSSFALVLHHAVTDGAAVGVLLHELSALLAGQPLSDLPALPASYLHWAQAQHQHWQGPARAAALAYWQPQLAPPADAPATSLPAPWPWASPSAPGQALSARSAKQQWSLRGPEWQATQALAGAQGVTVFTLMAALGCLMQQRLSGRFGDPLAYPIDLRDRPELEGMVGHMVNQALLCPQAQPDQSFAALLRQLGQQLSADAQAAQVPLAVLVGQWPQPVQAGQMPWARLLLAPNPQAQERLRLPGGQSQRLAAPTLDAPTDLCLVWTEDAHGLELALHHRCAAVPTAQAQRMVAHWQQLLALALADPQQTLHQLAGLTRLTATERLQLAQWNATHRPYPRDSHLIAQWRQQVQQRPQAAALSDGTRTLGYAELDHLSDALAQRLRAEHPSLQPGEPVALLLPRSVEQMVALLAILKAGGAYLPLQAEDPPQRLDRLLALSGARLLLTQSAQAMRLTHPIQRLLVDELPAPPAWAGTPWPEPAPTQAAYVLFTSGSTGEPKAVVVGHRQVLRLVYGQDFVQLGPDEVFLQAAPLAFDASTFEIWGCWLHGGHLVLLPPGPVSLPVLAQWTERERVSTLWLTAALFDQFTQTHLGALQHVRQLLSGGDVLPLPAVRRVLRSLPHCRLINGYGPTETTTFACCHPVSPDDARHKAVPIGRPLANTRIHLLDEQLQPVPVGWVGEICIAGDGVALGYLGQGSGEATDRFLPEPPELPGALPGQRMYRSADLGRLREDGVLEFWGRRDNQIKLRGHRVELAEVEATLHGLEHVAGAVVVVRDSPMGRQLVACVQPQAGAPLDTERLRTEAAQHLPHYMLPSRWWVMSTPWPVSATGKLDRRALAEQVNATLRTPISPPHQRLDSAFGRQIQSLWASLLEFPGVGPADDFFHLGGNSLLASRLCAAIERQHGLTVPLISLYQHPRLGDFVQHLHSRQLTQNGQTLWNPVVVLTPHAPATAPLVLVHSITGDVQRFIGLAARIGTQRPVLGLRGIQPLSAEHYLAQFPDLAAWGQFHAQALLQDPQVRQAGRVDLGGYSAGSVLAFFVEQALRREGVAVERLVVLDAEPPQPYTAAQVQPWVQAAAAEAGSPARQRELAFRQAFARALCQPFRVAPGQQPLQLVVAGRHGPALIRRWQAWWRGPLAVLHLPERNHDNFLLPPSDVQVVQHLLAPAFSPAPGESR